MVKSFDGLTREHVLSMAREAGLEGYPDELERFAALAFAAGQAAEREACAKVADLFESKADALNDSIADDEDRDEGRSEYVMGKAVASSRIAATIRARGQK